MTLTLVWLKDTEVQGWSGWFQLPVDKGSNKIPFSFPSHSQLVLWGLHMRKEVYAYRMAENPKAKWCAATVHEASRFLVVLQRNTHTWKLHESVLICSMHFLLPTSFVIFSHLWLALLFISHFRQEQAATLQVIRTIHLFQSSLKTLCHWKEKLWDLFTNNNCPVPHILQVR